MKHDSKNGKEITVENVKESFDNLQNMNLEGIKMNKRSNPRANFTNANFKEALLDGAFIENADLMGANFEEVDFVDGSLVGSNLTDAKISGADFIGTDLTDAILVDIESTYVFFNFADLTRTNFTGAKLTEFTTFDRAILKDTIFTGAELQNADFSRATNLNGTKFNNAKLQDAMMDNLDLRNVDFTGANLSSTVLLSANMNGMNLTTVVSMQNADLRDTQLIGAQLQGVNMNDAKMQLAHMNNANLTGANLTGAKLQGANLTGATLTGVVFTGANLTEAILTDVIGANFEGAILEEEQAVQPPPVPQGQAFEIHNYFNDLDFEKFLEIIRRDGESDNDELLEPLIDYATSFPTMEKADELNGINETINSYDKTDKPAVRDTIHFVLAQPEDFKKTYIQNLSQDCLFAYEYDPKRPNASRKSCVKGQYERVFMTLEGVLEAHCKDNEDETICPPVYRELLLCFKPDYNELFSEWFGTQDPDEDGYSGKTPEEKRQYIDAKKAELRAFIVERLGERNSIDAYINKVVQGKNAFEAVYETYDASGGRRKNRTKKRGLRVLKSRAKPKVKPGKKTQGKKGKKGKKSHKK